MSTLCSLLFLLNGAAFAGNNPFSEPDESEFFRLDQQLVTVAARYAQDVRHAPSIVTVIEHKEIRARGYRSLSDLLRELPGVYMWKNKEGRDLAAFRGCYRRITTRFW